MPIPVLAVLVAQLVHHARGEGFADEVRDPGSGSGDGGGGVGAVFVGPFVEVAADGLVGGFAIRRGRGGPRDGGCGVGY